MQKFIFNRFSNILYIDYVIFCIAPLLLSLLDCVSYHQHNRNQYPIIVRKYYEDRWVSVILFMG